MSTENNQWYGLEDFHDLSNQHLGKEVSGTILFRNLVDQPAGKTNNRLPLVRYKDEASHHLTFTRDLNTAEHLILSRRSEHGLLEIPAAPNHVAKASVATLWIIDNHIIEAESLKQHLESTPAQTKSGVATLRAFILEYLTKN